MLDFMHMVAAAALQAPNPVSVGRILLIVVIGCVVAGGIFLAAYWLLAGEDTTRMDLSERLAQFDFDGASSEQEAILNLPFSERVIKPFLQKVGDNVSGNVSAGQMKSLEQKISAAGNPPGLTPTLVVAQQMAGGVVGIIIGIGVVLLLGATVPNNILITVVFAVFGYLFPGMALDRTGKKRKREVIEGMPNALDLLTISVEAGLAFDAALARVADKYTNALSVEFHQVLDEMKLGRPRVEALEAMSTRLDLDEVTNFITAVNQSDQMGTSLGSTLRIQSEELRRRRTQRAEEAGAKAPVKMLLPMVACIFPTLFIVLLGPAALKVMSMVGGG